MMPSRSADYNETFFLFNSRVCERNQTRKQKGIPTIQVLINQMNAFKKLEETNNENCEQNFPATTKLRSAVQGRLWNWLLLTCSAKLISICVSSAHFCNVSELNGNICIHVSIKYISHPGLN